VLTASEIGQYVYCSNAWYLQRQGYKPVSPDLMQGAIEHHRLGEGIDTINRYTTEYRLVLIVGLLMLLLAMLIILVEVIL